jgi:hypothetical protein
MKVSFRTWLARILLVSITFVIVPPEFVHHFFHHNETEDDLFRSQGNYLEPQHQHCLILKVEIPEYVVNAEEKPGKAVIYSQAPNIHTISLLLTTHRNIDLRGPPCA